MDDLADAIRAAYESRSRREVEAVLGAASDALESIGGASADIHTVVRVLLDALDCETNTDVIEWTLETIGSATFHPNFGSVELSPLADFLRHAEARWLALGLEILGMSHSDQHRSFLESHLGRPDRRVAAAATEALAELDAVTER